MLPFRARVDLKAMAMKGEICISQNSSITGISPSDCLESYPGHTLRWGSYPLQRCSRCIFLTFYSFSFFSSSLLSTAYSQVYFLHYHFFFFFLLFKKIILIFTLFSKYSITFIINLSIYLFKLLIQANLYKQTNRGIITKSFLKIKEC